LELYNISENFFGRSKLPRKSVITCDCFKVRRNSVFLYLADTTDSGDIGKIQPIAT
jgi:hypothetical protein